VRKELPNLVIGAHFHDTRGVGLANVVAALDCGITRFDASLGGLGGCPYAPGATGNIVMEDLVFLLETMGYSTGVDLAALVEVRKFVAESLSHEQFHGAIAQAGLPKNYAHA
jgi:hydroxymethylglutaryl-CoA lyase